MPITSQHKMKNKKKDIKQLYIVRKYIWAKNAQQAIKLDKKFLPNDVWVDDEWKKTSNQPHDAIGFYTSKNNEY